MGRLNNQLTNIESMLNDMSEQQPVHQNTTDIDQSEHVPKPEAQETAGQFTLGQRRVIYLATFLIGVVTVVVAPVVTAIQAPAWIPALIGGLGSAAATISSAFGWRYLGK